MSRINGRNNYELRPISIIRNYQKYAEGSALIQWGDTWVLCSASVTFGVPPFLEGAARGWVTAEYGMLPRATGTRNVREGDKVRGRTAEIQRLIGRSLRAVINRNLIPGYTIVIDCDVLQADGGTRTAAVSGAYVALADACQYMMRQKMISADPLLDAVAAVSMGIVNDEILIDLDYREDSRAQVDMNVVFNGGGRLVEIQGTAEGAPFSRAQLQEMLDAATEAARQIFLIQKEALGK